MTKSAAVRVLALLALMGAGSAIGDDWPQWLGPTRDGRWRETEVIERFDGPEVPVVWRAGISSGYAGPTVADGRVYVSDRVAGTAEVERVHCFNALTGERLWTHAYACAYQGLSYPAGPRAAVTLHQGRAFSLGALGHFRCLDAVTGEVLWSKDLNAEYHIRLPAWGIAGAPLIEGDLVIVQIGGRDNACVTAFDWKSGAERWRALNDHATYAAPIALTQAAKRVVVCWTAERVVGLDAVSGALLWESAFPDPSKIIGVTTPVCDGTRLFVSDFWQGSLMLRILPDRPAIETIWHRRGTSEMATDALHTLMGTPVLDGEFLYGVDSHGELRCLKTANGDRVWENLDLLPKIRWGTIHIVRNGDRAWLFTERGELAVARLTPAGLEVLSRAQLIQPTQEQHSRGVCWTCPAFANRRVYIRNDRELLCASLEAKPATVSAPEVQPAGSGSPAPAP